MAYEGNQYSYYQNIQLDSDGALIVSIDGITGGTGTSSLGTHFGFSLNKNLYYNLQAVSDVIVNYGILSGVRVHPFVPKQTLTINQLSLYATSTGTTQIRIVCYNDVNGTPRDLLFQSPIITASTVGNYTYNTSYTFSAGTTYWIGIYGNGTTLFQAHDKLYVNPIGQGTLGATANYTEYVGTSTTFPDDVSTFPTTTQYTNGSLINIRFKFD